MRKLRFSERSITEFVTRYNTCRQSPFTASKASKQWTKVQMGITAGVTRSTLLTENIYDLSYMADRYHAVDAFTGMTFLISSPRISDHLKFQPEALVSKVNYSSSIVQKPASFYTNYYDTENEVTTLSTPLVVVYSLPEGKHFLQFHAGLNLDMHFTSDITVHREKVYNGVSTTTTEKPPLAIRKKQLGYLVGLAAFRSFSEFRAGLQLRYAGIGGYSDTVEFGYENRKLSLSLTVQVK